MQDTVRRSLQTAGLPLDYAPFLMGAPEAGPSSGKQEAAAAKPFFPAEVLARDAKVVRLKTGQPDRSSRPTSRRFRYPTARISRPGFSATKQELAPTGSMCQARTRASTGASPFRSS